MNFRFHPLLILFALLFASCGGGGTGAEKLFNEKQHIFEDYIEILEGVKTKQQAEKAIPKIEKLATAMQATKEKIWAKPKWNNELTMLDIKDERAKALRGRHQKVLYFMIDNPQLKDIVGPAMKAFASARSNLVD